MPEATGSQSPHTECEGTAGGRQWECGSTAGGRQWECGGTAGGRQWGVEVLQG